MESPRAGAQQAPTGSPVQSARGTPHGGGCRQGPCGTPGAATPSASPRTAPRGLATPGVPLAPTPALPGAPGAAAEAASGALPPTYEAEQITTLIDNTRATNHHTHNQTHNTNNNDNTQYDTNTHTKSCTSNNSTNEGFAWLQYGVAPGLMQRPAERLTNMIRKGTDGGNTHGVTANAFSFCRGTFWVPIFFEADAEARRAPRPVSLPPDVQRIPLIFRGI